MPLRFLRGKAIGPASSRCRCEPGDRPAASGSRDASRQLKALRRATVGRAATVPLPLTAILPRLAINRG
jgi:hypothetical protein